MPLSLLIPFVILPVGFMILTTIVARLEKRLVWQYGDGHLGPQPPYPDCAAYAAQWMEGALRCGFTLLGWAPDPRAPSYRTNYAVLVSPDRDCIAVCSSGTILKMPAMSITIYTRTLDDRVYSTVNHQNGVQIDLLWPSQLAPVGTFAELLARHQSLVTDRRLAVKPFTAGREIEEFRQLREERYATMARRGWIEYLDASQAAWRFTLWGALRYTLLNFPIGLLRGLTGARLPRCI